MNQQIHEEAAEWVIELRSRADATSRQRFDQWLSTSPEHMRAYLECAAIAQTAEAAPRSTPQEIEALLQLATQSGTQNVVPLTSTRSAREVSAPQSVYAQRRSGLGRGRLVRLGAAAMLLLAIGATTFYLKTRNLYTTAAGEQRSILLPDGSTIYLNGRSSVRVRLSADTRAIDLMEGEALFRVAENKARPFVVSANETRVRAVGTEFTVDRRERRLLVTVVDGTVAVSAPALIPSATYGTAGGVTHAVTQKAGSALAPSGHEILVGAGKQLALPFGAGASPPDVHLVDVDDAIAWTRRRLVFDSTPLGDVVADFNRHSARALVIQGSGLRDFHVSGAFSSKDVEPFLGFLRAQPGIDVIEEPDRIVIVPRHVQKSPLPE